MLDEVSGTIQTLRDNEQRAQEREDETQFKAAWDPIVASGRMPTRDDLKNIGISPSMLAKLLNQYNAQEQQSRMTSAWTTEMQTRSLDIVAGKVHPEDISQADFDTLVNIATYSGYPNIAASLNRFRDINGILMQGRSRGWAQEISQDAVLEASKLRQDVLMGSAGKLQIENFIKSGKCSESAAKELLAASATADSTAWGFSQIPNAIAREAVNVALENGEYLRRTTFLDDEKAALQGMQDRLRVAMPVIAERYVDTMRDMYKQNPAEVPDSKRRDIAANIAKEEIEKITRGRYNSAPRQVAPNGGIVRLSPAREAKSSQPAPQPTSRPTSRPTTQPSLTPQGMTTPGNIDLGHLPQVNNEDGSVSTVRSIGVNIDGKEVLLPTVSEDGKILPNEEAVAAYKKTGRHLGIFNTEADATAYAKSLHDSQAALLESQPPDSPESPSAAPSATLWIAGYALHNLDSDNVKRALEGSVHALSKAQLARASDFSKTDFPEVVAFSNLVSGTIHTSGLGRWNQYANAARSYADEAADEATKVYPKVAEMVRSISRRASEVNAATAASPYAVINSEDRISLVRDTLIVARTLKQIDALGVSSTDAEKIAKSRPDGWKTLEGARVADRSKYTPEYVTETLGVPKAKAEGFIMSLSGNTEEMLDALYEATLPVATISGNASLHKPESA